MSTTYERAWVGDYARDTGLASAPSSTLLLRAKWILWWWVQQLMGTNTGGTTFTTGLWTCAGSSDGVNGAMDGTDRWGGATHTPSKINRASSGAHSWFCLHHAGLGVWFLLDWSTGQDYQIKIQFGYSAPTGGSATAAPTFAAAETYTAKQFLYNGGATDAPGRIEIVLADNGMWHVTGSRNGQSKHNFICLHWATVLPPSSPTNVYRSCEYAEYSDTGICASSTLTSSSSNFVNFFGSDGATSLDTHCTFSTQAVNFGSGLANVFDLMPASDPNIGGAGDGNIEVWTNLAPFTGNLGRLPDLKWGPSVMAQGAVEPTTGPPYATLQVGSLMLPAPGRDASHAPLWT